MVFCVSVSIAFSICECRRVLVPVQVYVCLQQQLINEASETAKEAKHLLTPVSVCPLR